MPTEFWFPTPIYYALVGEETRRGIDRELAPLIDEVRRSGISNPWDDTVQTNFRYDVSVNSLARAPLLTSCIQSHVDKHLAEVDPGVRFTASLVDSWINYYGRGSYQNAHTHTSTSMSGVYIHQTNGEDGSTVFLPPPHFSSQPYSNHKNVAYRPEPGKIILFPSNLYHYVTINKTDHERISVAFNIDLVLGK